MLQEKVEQKFQWTKLSRKQARSLLRANAPINIWVGATRAGKTISSIVAWIEFIAKSPPGSFFLMVGKTFATLKRNVLDIIKDIVGSVRYSLHEKTGDITLKMFGKTIFIMGADNKEATTKVQGMRSLMGAYIDEATNIPESTFEMILTRLAVAGSTMFATCNPDSPFHWLKKKYINNAIEKRIRVFRFFMDDNPTLVEEFKQDIKNRLKGTVAYLRLVLAEWAVAEGLVYRCFNSEKNTIKKENIPDLTRFYISCDYGTENPTAFGLFGEDSENKVYMLKEYYYKGRDSIQKSPSAYAKDFKDFLVYAFLNYPIVESIPVFVDPSAKAFIMELMQNKLLKDYQDKFYIVTPDNSVEEGILSVSEWLNLEQFFVDKMECPKTLEEFGSYTYDENALLKGVERPKKENDHIMDLIRYLLHFLKTKGRPHQPDDTKVIIHKDYAKELGLDPEKDEYDLIEEDIDNDYSDIYA